MHKLKLSAVPGDKLPSSSEVLGRDTGQTVEAAKTGRTDAGPLHDDRPSLLASAARKANDTLMPRAKTDRVEFRGVVPLGCCRLVFAKARARLKKRRNAGLSLPGHQIALN